MNKIQWVIADKDGNKREGAYETQIEAYNALERLRLAAVKLQSDAKVRAQEGRPHYTDRWDIEAVKNFDEHLWRVKEETMSASVYRLNASIADDPDFLREVLWKLRVNGHVEICWTCIGHTRSITQGESTAALLERFGYSCIVAAGGDVVVEAKAGKEVR